MLVSCDGSQPYHPEKYYPNTPLLRNIMNVAAQQIAVSLMERATDDVDMNAPTSDSSPSLFTAQCVAFQTRIDSVRPSPLLLRP